MRRLFWGGFILMVMASAAAAGRPISGVPQERGPAGLATARIGTATAASSLAGNELITRDGSSRPDLCLSEPGGEPMSCAFGSVFEWGYDTYGELGDGLLGYSSTPVQPLNMSGVATVACGAAHVIALKSDGTVWAWGSNDYGQLGDGTTMPRNIPVQVVRLSGVVAIGAGYYHSLVVKSDGTAWA